MRKIMVSVKFNSNNVSTEQRVWFRSKKDKKKASKNEFHQIQMKASQHLKDDGEEPVQKLKKHKAPLEKDNKRKTFKMADTRQKGTRAKPKRHRK